MPNPTLNAATKNNAAIAAAQTNATVTSNGSVTVGNLQIVAIEIAGAIAPSGITPPAGWTTLLATTTTEASGLVSAAIFYRVATASGAFSGSFSWTTASTGGEWLFMEWSGVGSALIDGAATTNLNTSTTTPTSPAITPSAGNTNDTLVGIIFGGVLSASTVAIPAGMTSILTVSGSATQTLFGAASLNLSSASTAAAETWTLGTAQAVLGVSFLLPPTPWSEPDRWADQVLPNVGDARKAQRGRLYVPFFQVWYPPNNWPDLISKSVNTAANAPYLAFVYPSAPSFTWSQAATWNEPTPRPRQTPDISGQSNLESVLPPSLMMQSWLQWPDFAIKTKPPTNYLPWSFLSPPPQIWYPPVNWADTAPAAKRVAQNSDWSYGTFVTPTAAVTWNAWTQWPDFAPKARSPVNYQPWTFLEPAPQVWYPPSVWPDSVPGAKRIIEFPTLAALGFPPLQVWYPPNPWGDFATKQKPPLNYDPLAFLQVVISPLPTMDSWLQWPDSAIRAKGAVDFRPWSFIAPTQPTVWTQWSPWPDIDPVRAKPPVNYLPWQFIEPAPQIWYPPNYWGDFATKQRSPLNYDPLTFVSLVVVSAPNMGWVNWPDFANAKKPAPDLTRTWNFLEPPPQVWYPPYRWNDIVYKKSVPLNYVPQTLGMPTATPWNEWSTWPEFAPIRAKIGQLADLQPSLFFYPGTIPLPGITGTMLAIGVTSDGAIFTINVVPFSNIAPPGTFTTNPPASAVVGIYEIGIEIFGGDSPP